MQLLKELEMPSFVNIVEMVKCRGKEHLKEYANDILAKGGEGVMLREPLSLYKRGRSTSLKKFKPFQDAELRVLKNNYPKLVCEQYEKRREI
jgi:DNA ligase-1